MRIHLTGAFEYMDSRVGFGNAAVNINEQFRKAGVWTSCKQLDSSRKKKYPIEMCFDQPHRFSFSCPDAYRIGYVPWESTELMPTWYQPLRECNEIWTPNEFGRKVFSHHFPDKPVIVYQHGVSPRFRPRKRKLNPDKPFTFLFIGEPYARKNGQMVVDAFVKLFGNNPDYRLIIKGTHQNTTRVLGGRGEISAPPNVYYDNIIVSTKMLNDDELLLLYDEADVFLYPSSGEGWGFNPMQALAMGIPTISTYDWADYMKYITIPIDSTLVYSPWQELHPGMFYKPDHNQLAYEMKRVRENYDYVSSIAFRNAFEVHKRYNWERVTIPAVNRLKKIFSTLESKSLAC